MTSEKTEFKVKGEELIRKIKELIHQGNIRRIIIKDENGYTFMEIPFTVGIIGTALVPIWAALGALAALVSHFTIEVIKKEDDPADTSGDINKK